MVYIYALRPQTVVVGVTENTQTLMETEEEGIRKKATEFYRQRKIVFSLVGKGMLTYETQCPRVKHF